MGDRKAKEEALGAIVDALDIAQSGNAGPVAEAETLADAIVDQLRKHRSSSGKTFDDFLADRDACEDCIMSQLSVVLALASRLGVASDEIPMLLGDAAEARKLKLFICGDGHAHLWPQEHYDAQFNEKSEQKTVREFGDGNYIVALKDVEPAVALALLYSHCPFCGKETSIGTQVAAEGGHERASHESPGCAQYRALSGEAFKAAVLAAREHAN